ncbi:NmrA-like family-domain-containing protein [Mycena vitilis]|nr:NmrA-like family-domain-containing protein [Mycena vitilis]
MSGHPRRIQKIWTTTMTITHAESAPLIAVVGATGVQGGSVIKALAESDKPYRVRGFTRDVTKATSETLEAKGIEMVAVNLVVENKDEVYRAFAGAAFAFLVTNFWEHMDVQKEISEGKMLVDAAKAAGVKGIVWSGLRKIHQGSSIRRQGRRDGIWSCIRRTLGSNL